MAIIADKHYSLVDYAKQFDSSGQELAIAEVLSQSNDIIADALVTESSLDSGHEYAVRTGIPEGTWRRAYQGIEPAKATTKVVVESYGTLSAYSVVDKLVAEKGGHVEAVRTGQSRAIIAGMSNTMASNLIYGNVGEHPERFTGLAVRTGIPEGTWRRAYQGIEPAKATTKVVVESYGTLSAYSVVDKLVAEKGGHVEAVRTGQSRAIIAGMSNTMASNLIYGNVGEHPERFTGLAARYCELDGAESSRNVIDAGGDTEGQNSSIYLVVWDTDKVFTFFPKGSKAGIQRVDHGLVNHIDADGNEYPAYKEYFEWKLGLAVQDWRYAGRICNIDVKNVPSDLIDQMCELEERIQSLSMGKPVWYMNRTVKAALRKLTSNRTNVQYTPDQITSRPLMTFNEIPVHICDAITDTEAVVK